MHRKGSSRIHNPETKRARVERRREKRRQNGNGNIIPGLKPGHKKLVGINY